MASWVETFLLEHPELEGRIAKRGKFSLHTTNNQGLYETHFLTCPVHYKDEFGGWQPIDTDIIDLGDGTYGSKGIPVKFTLGGLVKILNDLNQEIYSQITTRVAVYNSSTDSIESYTDLPTGTISGNQLIKETSLYKHTLTLIETGLREEILIKEKPSFINNSSDLWLALDTVVTGITLQDGWIDEELVKDEYRFPIPTAVDADGREGNPLRYAKNVAGVQHILTGLRFSELQHATYPIIIDPDFSCYTTDGYIGGSHANYSTARADSLGYNQTAPSASLGQRWTGSTYNVWRGFLSFNTSSIGSTGRVAQVYMYINILTDNSDTDFDIYIKKFDWSSYNDFSDSGERESAFDGALAASNDDNILCNTSTGAGNKWSGLLDPTWVNITGATSYALISKEDIDNSAPTGNEWVEFLTADYGGSSTLKPRLIVEYGYTDYPFITEKKTGSYTSGTSHQITLPSTIDDGDLLVALTIFDGYMANTPTGWTSLTTANAGSSRAQLRVCYLICDGTEDGDTIDFTTSGSATGGITIYRITADSWYGSASGIAGGSTTGTSNTPNPPSLSPSWGSDKNLWIALAGWDYAISLSGYPTNYEMWQTNIDPGAFNGELACAADYVEASSEDPGTFSISSSRDWATATIAIRPKAATADSDSQSAYLKGQDTGSDNQPAYLKGQDTATDNQAVYTRGGYNWTSGDAPNLVLSGAGTSGVNGTWFSYRLNFGKPMYSDGDDEYIYWGGNAWYISDNNNGVYWSTEDVATPDLVTNWQVIGIGELPVPTITPISPFYLVGADTDNDNQSVYLCGGIVETDNQEIYIEGQDIESSNKSAYLCGKDTSSDNQEAYIKGADTSLDNQIAYLDGKDSETSSTEVYLKGAVVATDNQDIYLKGKDTASDSTLSYLHGGIVETDNLNVFLRGQDAGSSNKSVYLQGEDTASDSQEVYLTGNLSSSSSTSAFIHGKDTASSSKASYMLAGIVDTDSISAYTSGDVYEDLPPDSDVEVNSWKNELEGSTLWSSIDEYPFVDDDYAYFDSPSGNEYFEVALANPEFDDDGTGTYTIIWRCGMLQGNDTVTMKVELRQGASTVIASDQQVLTGSFVTHEYQLTQEEIDSITNFDDLRLRFIVVSVV